MATQYPEYIVSPRWPYAMLTGAAGLMVATVAMILMTAPRWDWTFFAVFIPIEAGLIAWLVTLAPKTLRPPAIRIDDVGVTLRKGLKGRTWQWHQIDTFYSRRLPRGGSMVGFRWQATFGAPWQGTWLNYPFLGGTATALERLTKALAAARRSGVRTPAAPTVIRDPQVAVRWRRRLNITFVILIIGFIAFVIDLNTARTELVTPVSPVLLHGLELLGGALGLSLTVSMIGIARTNTATPSPTSALVTGGLLLGAAFVFSGAALGGYAAWRAGDLMPFAGGDAVAVPKHYRIVYFGRAKQDFYAEIEPYRAAGYTRLPVSRDDYARLIAADRPYEVSVYCYPVVTQSAAEAVRIFKPSPVRQHEQRIAPCSATTDDRWRS